MHQPSLRELFRTLCPNELKTPSEKKKSLSNNADKKDKVIKLRGENSAVKPKESKVYHKNSGGRRSSRIKKMKSEEKSGNVLRTQKMESSKKIRNMYNIRNNVFSVYDLND